MYWGFWKDNLKALNYYRAYITKLNDTHVDFVLQMDKRLTRSYRRTEPVFIIDDKISDIKNVALNAPVIAQQRSKNPEWYRTGTVIGTSGTSLVSVKFDDDVTKWVRLEIFDWLNDHGFVLIICNTEKGLNVFFYEKSVEQRRTQENYI
ncbi:hypothetical protein OS493_027682 [Desmophyllum pertusum]|uniref:Uncharacterized protein n=1 Tax=Desmophyllum pertusum TaxID=174260 RepID=A0A9X0D1T5_9CNID|nr:hypothetical protein OS493_027682 [Desmophyllum pertusum]